MMSTLMERGNAIAKAAKRRRIDQVAAQLGSLGLVAERGAGEVICRGRRLVRRWLADGRLRFAARIRP